MTVPARQNLTAAGQWTNPTRKLAGADLASAARTATGQSAAFPIENAIEIDYEVAVTAATGTGPTLQVKLQVSQDGVTWYDAWPNALPNLTGVGTQRATATAHGVFGRWVWTIGGTTPNFTFAIDHQAVLKGF